jgi:hypothetical protein
MKIRTFAALLTVSVAVLANGCSTDATQGQTPAQTGTVFTVTDSRDLKLLQMAEGAKMNRVTLPSGRIVPSPPEGKEWRVRKGKLVLEDSIQNAAPQR